MAVASPPWGPGGDIAVIVADTFMLAVTPNSGAKSLGDRQPAGPVGVAEDQRELLAADAREPVELASAGSQHTRQTYQDCVAHVASEAVVDLLEVVEVAHHDRDTAIGAPCALELQVEHLTEGLAV